MVYAMQEVGPQVVKVSSKLGGRAPLHASGLGKAYLSGLPDGEAIAVIDRLDLIQWTPTTITSREALITAVRQDRARGYSIDDAEREPGVRCIAAPIRDAAGAPVASLSVAGPTDRIRAAQSAIIDAVRATTAGISAELGYVDLDQPHRVPGGSS
jgi:IclR family acetate operon transcriptional repressor